MNGNILPSTATGPRRPSLWSPERPAPPILRAEARRRANRTKLKLAETSQVKEAIRDPFIWATRYTKTFNPHWEEEGLEPYLPFPDQPYFDILFKMFSLERIWLLEKSRDMMVTWACVAYFTCQAQRTPERRILFQSQEENKVIELIDYAKCLYNNQPEWLREAFPLAKPVDSQKERILQFANGAEIYGLVGGPSKIRSYHPWGYLNDESSFQAEAGECYIEALSAVKGKIIFNSSAGPGWYADFRRDIVRNMDE